MKQKGISNNECENAACAADKKGAKRVNCEIGGQAVLEGVMMASKTVNALSVRQPTGEVLHKKWDKKQRNGKLLKWPIVRGVLNFWDSMVGGVGTLTDAAKLLGVEQEEEPSKLEKYIAKKTGKDPMDVMMVFAVILSLALAVGMFFILPTVITNWVKGSITNPLIINLIDGLVRIVIFVCYLVLVRLMKDIRRTFSYHGAEHKTLAAYEHGLPLTVENVRNMSRLHPRCGTSYILIVMIATILIFALLGWSSNLLLRFGLRLVLIPFIAGLSYEFLKFAARHEGIFFEILRWPGLQVQRLTTLEPDDSMIECAILSFESVLGEKSEEEIEELRKSFCRPVKQETAADEKTERGEAAAPETQSASENAAAEAPLAEGESCAGNAQNEPAGEEPAREEREGEPSQEGEA